MSILAAVLAAAPARAAFEPGDDVVYSADGGARTGVVLTKAGAKDLYLVSRDGAESTQYVLPGSRLSLRDIDGDGFVDAEDDCPSVAGLAPDGCPPPTADFTWSPRNPVDPPIQVGFDSAPSACPAPPCTFSWDHGPGGPVFGTGPAVTFTYQHVGAKTPRLTITDSQGRSISKTHSLEVTVTPPPAAQCANGFDDDSDGLVDMGDPGCSSSSDVDESNVIDPPPIPATLFVTPNGSGSACTQAQPCGSFNAAYQRAQLGDVVNVAAGSYGQQNVSPRSLPGTNSQTPSGEEITFKGPGATVNGMVLSSVRGAPVEHIAFDGITFAGWTATRSGEDVHFVRTTHRSQLHANWVRWLSYRNFEVGPFTDGTGDGLQFNQIDGQAGDHLLIEGGRIHDVHPNSTAAHPDAIQFYGPYHDVTLSSNRLWNNDNINLRGDPAMQRYVVENNVFGAANQPVVTRYYTAQIQGDGAVIRHNTFDGAIQPSGAGEADGQVWANNLGSHYSWGACPPGSGLGNVWYGGMPSGCGKRVSSPGWVGGGDYRLTASSGAIDAASPQHALATDLDGKPRGAAPDAGAYEFGP